MGTSAEWPLHVHTTPPEEHEQRAHERGVAAYQEGVEDRIWDAMSAVEAARERYRSGGGSTEEVREAERNLRHVYETERERLEHASGLEPVEVARIRDWLAQRMHEGRDLERDRAFAVYEGEVESLFEGAANLETYAELLERRGAFDRDTKEDFHDQLNRFYEQLQELDARRMDGRPSPERDRLINLLQRLHDRYPVSERRPSAPTLSQAHALQRTVRAQYAAVQHDLSLEQRRALRARIATLSSLVRRAEDARYRELFQHPLRVRIASAIERATEHAPLLAGEATRKR
ncbi:MAG: hypothetical protein IT406_03085 [Candidatus Yanofskybacteria bacterium]|nr:hypothetical protein [Candidatus Yanofskybacteria bacterium]